MGASMQKLAERAVGGPGCLTYCDCTGLDCGSDCVSSDDEKEHVCSGCKAAAAAAEVSTCFLRLNALPVHVELPHVSSGRITAITHIDHRNHHAGQHSWR
jgi:hypothetical protein